MERALREGRQQWKRVLREALLFWTIHYAIVILSLAAKLQLEWENKSKILNKDLQSKLFRAIWTSVFSRFPCEISLNEFLTDSCTTWL
jgi:Trk-type K+ transport system membrane component